MTWEYKNTDFEEMGTVPSTDIKHKCPCCKKIKRFRRIDVNSEHGTVYCGGYDMPLYRCEKCWIIIGVGKWVN
jgi:phage FluMu protein Com